MLRAAKGEKIDNFPVTVRRENGRTETHTSTLENVGRANDTLAESRDLLRNGRPNVSSDRALNSNELDRRHKAGKELESFYKQEYGITNPSLRERMEITGGVRRFTEQSTCGGSAAVATPLHVSKLEGLQTSNHVKQINADHEWTEIRQWKKVGDFDPIIDRWQYGPAPLRENSSNLNAPTFPINTLNKISGPASQQEVLRHERNLRSDPQMQKYYASSMDAAARQDSHFKGRVWDPQSTLNDKFLQDSRTAMDRTAVQKEIMAVGVARDLGAPNIRSAVDAAPKIIESGHRVAHGAPAPPSQGA